MTYLLDTCILSKLRKIKKQRDPLLEEWIEMHSEEQYFLSALTIGEIQKGIAQCNDSINQRTLDNWLSGEVIPRFKERIIALDEQVMITWGDLYGSHSKRGIVLPTIDSLIAATAMTYHLIVVTDNTSDFEKIQGLKIFNPWKT